MTPLYRFDDEAAAQADAAVGPLYQDGGWRGDVCIPNVQVTDDQGQAVPGFFIRVAGPALDTPGAYALPDGYTAQPDFAGVDA